MHKRYMKELTFSNFAIDKESLGPIVPAYALTDKKCTLEEMKLSIKSLISLDFESCHMVGAFLKGKKLNISLSQTVNQDAMLKMLNASDTDKNGYLDLNEFSVAFDCFSCFRCFRNGTMAPKRKRITLDYTRQNQFGPSAPINLFNMSINSPAFGLRQRFGSGASGNSGASAVSASDRDHYTNSNNNNANDNNNSNNSGNNNRPRKHDQAWIDKRQMLLMHGIFQRLAIRRPRKRNPYILLNFRKRRRWLFGHEQSIIKFEKS